MMPRSKKKPSGFLEIVPIHIIGEFIDDASKPERTLATKQSKKPRRAKDNNKKKLRAT
jgi:hypothetical protein